MPLHQPTLERQLLHATEQLAAFAEVLDKQGVDAAKRDLDPRWRHLSSACVQIRSRIRAAAEIVARDEEVARAKAEKAAAPKEKSAPSKKSSSRKKKADPGDQLADGKKKKDASAKKKGDGAKKKSGGAKGKSKSK